MKKIIIDSGKKYPPVIISEEKDMFYNKALCEEFEQNYPFNFPDEDNSCSKIIKKVKINRMENKL